jgi:UDP:flavonoid glycosyltransferase YjiC (YdhE family)
VRGVVTTGPLRVSHPHGSNVDVRAHLDHVAVLPETAVLVSHGGHGSVLGALSVGVPVVCVPQGRDQADIAARLRRLGAGVVVNRRSTPSRLRRAIRTVLGDDRYARSAVAASAAIRNAEVADPVALLERVAAANARPRTAQ